MAALKLPAAIYLIGIVAICSTMQRDN